MLEISATFFAKMQKMEMLHRQSLPVTIKQSFYHVPTAHTALEKPDKRLSSTDNDHNTPKA